jgi:membrane protein
MQIHWHRRNLPGSRFRRRSTGDTIYDVDAARRAGIATIGVTSGPFDAGELKDAGAIAVFPDVASILRDFDRSPLAG